MGSEQEFVETRILGGFLKNDEFGLGDRHALGFEQPIAEILVAAAPSKESFDVAVDGFHHSEAYLGAAVVEDAVQVIQQHVGEFLKVPISTFPIAAASSTGRSVIADATINHRAQSAFSY
jgi:hypothetical protein